MVVRLKLAIDQEEYSALLKLALSELRNPEDQLHHILREELKRRGLIRTQKDLPNSKSSADRPKISEEVQIV